MLFGISVAERLHAAVERTGQFLAAFLDEQPPGQEWLPIGDRALQIFPAVVPRLGQQQVM